jgi:hypothetical protein
MNELQRFRAVVVSRDAPPRSTVTMVDVDARDAPEARHLTRRRRDGANAG